MSLATPTINDNLPTNVDDTVLGSMVPEAIANAGAKIAPLWPLKTFVAVNPFLGLADKSYAQAAHDMNRAAGAKMAMPRSYYADAIASGRIAEDDLTAALTAAPAGPGRPADVADLMAATKTEPTRPATHPTIADIARDQTGTDWPGLVVDRISAWAAGYFDAGQAAWSADQTSTPYAAWRAEAMTDRTAKAHGLPKFRKIVATYPDDAAAAALMAVKRLGLPAEALPPYFHRLLMSVAGWAGYARYVVWNAELYGNDDATLAEFLTIRLVWDAALLDAVPDTAAAEVAWSTANAVYLDDAQADASFVVDGILQSAYERAWQRDLIAKFEAGGTGETTDRPAAQVAFCIDVRSEVFRRALEGVAPGVETVGFAGFFGFAIEYAKLGHADGGAQCPVLLTPGAKVREGIDGADGTLESEVGTLRALRRRVNRAKASFKYAAVSSFAFVEALGLGYVAKLVGDGWGLSRPTVDPDHYGIDGKYHHRLLPKIDAEGDGDTKTGFTPEEQLDMAEGVLKAMSMTENFGRIVLLAGHGATTVNNPHASGLDCGACGGHTGEANARVAAAILNRPHVRDGLVARGIVIPDDTIFLGGLHDTTTDDVALFEDQPTPDSHAGDLAQLRDWLALAGQVARTERAASLGLDPESAVDADIVAKSRDWSEVRPEWGLAGCAAFIAAPRHRSAGIDLGGRSFLHDYDWQADDGFGVLELIMTAPMVVASWISLQYFGSAVDNTVFGSGNKTLHNVVGTIGVLEGNGGDLRTGLPMQSVHDGDKLMHEPLRLSVVIEAPSEAMTAIIDKHDGVRDLLDNGWLNLFRMDGEGRIVERYDGGLEWSTVSDDAIAKAA